jgi:hypothetical protein
MISDRALWIRVAIDNVVSDVMAYVVDNAESDELILGMDWISNYTVSFPRDIKNDKSLPAKKMNLGHGPYKTTQRPTEQQRKG